MCLIDTVPSSSQVTRGPPKEPPGQLIVGNASRRWSSDQASSSNRLLSLDTPQPHLFQRKVTNILPRRSGRAGIGTLSRFSPRAAVDTAGTRAALLWKGEWHHPAQAPLGFYTTAVARKYIQTFQSGNFKALWNGPRKFLALIFRKIRSL